MHLQQVANTICAARHHLLVLKNLQTVAISKTKNKKCFHHCLPGSCDFYKKMN